MQRVFIKWKVVAPPNIEEPVVIQKKELEEKRNSGIPSHMTEVLISQNHDSEFGEVEIGVSHSILEYSLRLYIKKYVSDIALHNIPLVENMI